MGNREALLEAAIVSLRERGYGGTRARDVTTAAGVSLGAIRYHFGSMESLMNEAVGQTFRQWIHGLQASVAKAGAENGIRVSTDAMYQFYADNEELLAGYVEVFAHSQRSPDTRAQLAAIYDELRAETAKMLPRQRDSEAIASILLALSDGLMIQWLLDPKRCPDPKVYKRAASAVLALCDPAQHHSRGR